jgi:hypothetical protein
MANRLFRDRDIKYIWALVIDEKPDGWCKVVFQPKGDTTYNYHIEYLKAFYTEHIQEQETATGGDSPVF